MARSQPARPRRLPKDRDEAPPEPPGPERLSRWAAFRYLVLAGLIWCVLGGGLIFSHWISELPDIGGLMAAAPTQDVTLLDD